MGFTTKRENASSQGGNKSKTNPKGEGVKVKEDAVLKTYLTINELSKYLKVSKPTIYVWLAKNLIPHIRINKKVIRFEVEAVDAFMTKNEVA
jgi:excisionase family DNA binding protein